jgi:hypothetical protein
MLSATERADPAIRAAGWALFVFSLFPYLSIIPIPTDTQPYAVVFAALIFLTGRSVALPLPIWILFAVMVIATIVYLATGATFNGLRSMVGYASVFLVSAAVLILAFHGIRLSDRMLDVAVYIWLVVGVAQRFISSDFLAIILTRSGTSEGRGVTSLAVEPSAYATMMLFILIIYFIRGRERSWPAVLCLLQILFLAQSALGILFALFAVGLYTLIRLSAPAALITLLTLAGISFYLLVNAENLLAGTRIGGLRRSPYEHRVGVDSSRRANGTTPPGRDAVRVARVRAAAPGRGEDGEPAGHEGRASDARVSAPHAWRPEQPPGRQGQADRARI